MKLRGAEKMNGFRKLSLFLAFVLTFTQMPQTGMIMAYAKPGQESVSVPDAGETADENTEPVSGEEETFSAGSVSEDAGDLSEETVSPDQVKTEGEDAAGGSDPIVVTSWNGLQAAFNKKGNMSVKLGGNITASVDEKHLDVPANTDVTLDLDGKTLDRNCKSCEHNDYVIQINNNASLTISDTSVDKKGCITGGNYFECGGGISVFGGTLTLKNGHIRGNHARKGGAGVYVSSGSFNMTGGSIEDNISDEGNGGGVLFSVYSGDDKLFSMTGGEIKNNSASGNGGGVCVYGQNEGSTASLNMTGGKIYGNRNNDADGFGGGVYAFGENSGKVLFNMTGGTIGGDGQNDANISKHGAGIYLHGNTGTVSFNMSGGSIENNVATGGSGGGVLVCAENSGKAFMNMSGEAGIYDNRAEFGGGVYLLGYKDPVTFNMDGGSIYNNTAVKYGGGVYADADDGGSTDITINNGNVYDNTAEYGGGVYARGKVTGRARLTMNSGNICRNKALDGKGGGVYICSSPSENGGYTTGGKADFYINGGCINDNSATKYGGGVYGNAGQHCGTSISLNAGSIDGNSAESGGGVCADSARFSMADGSISGNTANGGKGGGVYIRGNNGGSVFSMKGGRINNNKASEDGYGGGVAVSSTSGKAAFTTEGGEIDGNFAKRGGGVYAYSGGKESITEFTLINGRIRNNTATENGGGICSGVEQYCWTKLFINGGVIEGNKALHGGGVYTYTNVFNLNGGRIEKNTATGNGGGVFINGGQFTVSSGNISGNTAAQNGGGAYVVFTRSTQFNVGGNYDFEIKENKDTNGSVSGNVCLAYSNADTKINVTGKLQNTTPIGVKAVRFDTNNLTGGVITKGLKGNGDLSNFEGEGSAIKLNAEGEVIYEAHLQGISLPSEESLKVGESITIPVTFIPEDASNKNVTWTVSNEKIATVANGVVTGVAVGETVVTAKSEEGGFTASCKIMVKDPDKKYYTVTFVDDDKDYASRTVEDGMTLTKPEKDPVKEGYEFMGWAKGNALWNFSTPVHSSFTLYSKYIANSPEAVSENTGSGMDPVAKVDKNDQGRIIYLVKGQSYVAGGSGWSIKSGGGISVAKKTGKITANKKGHYLVENEGSHEIITVAVAAPQFEKSQKTRSVMVGKTGWISLNINAESNEENRNFPVTWATANPAVATVENGTITAYSKGNTNVYAYCGGKTYTAKITVSDTFKAKTQTSQYAYLQLNPLQAVNLKFDKKVGFTMNGASWNSITGPELVPTVNTKTSQPDGGYANGVVKITKAGKITAVGSSKEPIFIHGSNKGKDVYVTIEVVNIPSSENTYVNINKQVTIKFPFVKNNDATWVSLSKNIIPDASRGKVKGKAVGNSTISCNYSGFDFKTLVYVENPEFNTDGKLKVENNKYVLNLKKGEVYNRVTMKNVFQTVYYKSSKTAVAFIDENGVVYARDKGKANITTKINGKTYKIAVTVAE